MGHEITSCTTYVSTVTNNAFGYEFFRFDISGYSYSHSRHRKNFGLSYYLDFDDPNNDSYWDRLNAAIYDVITGINLYQSLHLQWFHA